MKQLDFWIFIYNKLNRNLKVNLIIIVEPIVSGGNNIAISKMAVSEDVDTFGSINYSDIDTYTLEKIRGTLSEGEDANIFTKVQSDNGTKEYKTLIVKTLGRNDRDTVKLIIDNLEEQKNGILSITYTFLSYQPESKNNQDLTLYDNENEWKFEENIGVLNTIYIVGGNHLGLALSKTISSLDFFIVLLDEISDLSTIKNNEYCNKKIITNYSEINKYILPSKKSYIIINTPSFEKNKIVLKSIENIDFKYIGLVNNINFQENKKIYDIESLKKTYKNIHYPAGIDINSKNPEETAVSIVSEIISIKNNL